MTKEAILESVFEDKFISRLRELQDSWWPFKSTATTERGIPDRIGCINGRFVALEFKRSQGEAAKTEGRIVLQRYNLAKLRDAGAIALFVYPENKEEIYSKLWRQSYGFNV